MPSRFGQAGEGGFEQGHQGRGQIGADPAHLTQRFEAALLFLVAAGLFGAPEQALFERVEGVDHAMFEKRRELTEQSVENGAHASRERTRPQGQQGLALGAWPGAPGAGNFHGCRPPKPVRAPGGPGANVIQFTSKKLAMARDDGCPRAYSP